MPLGRNLRTAKGSDRRYFCIRCNRSDASNPSSPRRRLSDALWAIYDRGISNDGWLVINQQQRQELFEVVNQINPADAFFSLREEIITPAQQQSYVRFSQSIVILEQTLPEGIAYAAVKPYLTHHHPDLRGQVFGMVREHDTPLAIFDTLLYNDIYKTPVIEMTSVPLKGLDLKMYTSSR